MDRRPHPSETSQIVDTENRDYAAEREELLKLAQRDEGIIVTDVEAVADIAKEHKAARIAIMGSGSHPGMTAALLRSLRERGLDDVMIVDPATVVDLKLRHEVGQRAEDIPIVMPELMPRSEFVIHPYDDKRMRPKPAPVVKQFTEQDQQRLDAAAAKRARKAAKLRGK